VTLIHLAAAGMLCLSLHAQVVSPVVSVECAPSSPVALSGETVRLSAWANLPDGSGKPVYAWTVSSGEVRPAGVNVFTWKFGKDAAGVATADGELRTGSTVQARCLVEVQAIASRTAALDSGMLLPAGQERDGAGFYSYLLISATANRELMQSALRTWLPLNGPVAELRRVLKPNEPIALGLPVLEKPSGDPDAEWVLQHYDFARARALLENIFATAKSGIYIVSSLQPISQSRAPYLVQDLSAASPALAAAWVEAFINEAAQEHTWNPGEVALLVDQLRATVLSLAAGMPDIKLPLLMKWIALV
jgi:hypothetical protein